MIDFAPEIIALLFAAAVAAGFVDAIAGGGGLITVPVLLAVTNPATANAWLLTSRMPDVLTRPKVEIAFLTLPRVTPPTMLVPLVKTVALTVPPAA